MLRFICLILIGCGLSGLALAQDEEGDGDDGAPQILTSDLFRSQVVENERMAVNFVFADDDNVTEIVINGEPQQFTPGRTVLITKRYRFNPGVTRITVTAGDEKGNRRTKSYLVAFQVEIEEEPEEEKPELLVFYAVAARYEFDDNPTTDLSVPVPVGDLDKRVPSEGAVPDSKQGDFLTTLQGSVTLVRDNMFGMAGAVITDYAKAENEFLETQTIFLVFGMQFPQSETVTTLLTFILTDLNVGGNDFALMETVSYGYNIAGEREDKTRTNHLFSGEFTLKDFASEDQDDGFQTKIKWEFSESQPDQDRYRSAISLGTNDDGISQSQYNFIGFDFDWRFIWPAGFRLDTGYGFQYRDYPNDKEILVNDLGDTRLDLLNRINLGAGWQFNPQWSLMFNIDTFVNVSNKTPYQRNKYGLVLEGSF